MPIRKRPHPIEYFAKLRAAAKEKVKLKRDKADVIASQAKKQKEEYKKKQDRIDELRRRVLQRKKIGQVKKPQKQERKRYNKRRFHQLLIKAGIDRTPEEVAKFILFSSVALVVFGSIVAFYYLMQDPLFTWTFGMFMGGIFATLGFGLSYGLVWVAYHQYMDMSIYRRRSEVENVLPDFLLLTSANVRAGMTIDKALWNAVRPRFGVLAKEIEVVAKKTLSGEDLQGALYDFADSYDSPLLKRSISLLVEGLNAGGEIASLLNDIALNIQEIQTMHKEMASNVTTYAIFINFATLIAAPFLFGLAGQLLRVITKLTSRVTAAPSSSSSVQNSGGGTSVGFSFSGGSHLTYNEFLLFAIITLSMTAIMSTIIVGTIKKGNAREALSQIPVSLIVTISLFFLASHVLGSFLGNLI